MEVDDEISFKNPVPDFEERMMVINKFIKKNSEFK